MAQQEQFNVVVVGGGAAGWMTALFSKKFFSDSVTVIASEEIGILGAGESTLALFPAFLRSIDIDPMSLFTHGKATVKNGTKFADWTGDGSDYFLPLGTLTSDTSPFTSPCKNRHPITYLKWLQDEKDLRDLDFVIRMLREDRCGFTDEKNTNVGYAVNFDAGCFAKYLKEIAISRGIKYINARVDGVAQSDIGDITDICIDSGERIPADFVFDCSGFARLFIGGVYDAKWIDYRKYLPVDSTVPFFIERGSEKTPAYLTSSARKNGWIWQTPLQHRWGCGYVYDSRYATVEEIKKEIHDEFGEVFIPKTFSFKAGCYETPWVNNCVAIGVSSGFLEPLEASSIWTILQSLMLLRDTESVTKFGAIPEQRENFNRKSVDFSMVNVDFIYAHYLGGRKDSPFWADFSKNTEVPPNLQRLLNVFSKKIPCPYELQMFFDRNNAYSVTTWIHVLHGLGVLSKDAISNTIENAGINPVWVDEDIQRLIQAADARLNDCLDHDYFLNGVTNGNAS